MNKIELNWDACGVSPLVSRFDVKTSFGWMDVVENKSTTKIMYELNPSLQFTLSHPLTPMPPTHSTTATCISVSRLAIWMRYY